MDYNGNIQIIMAYFTFQIRIDKLNTHWSSSLMVGVLGFTPDRFNFPVSAINIKKSCIVIQGDDVYSSGVKVRLCIFCQSCFTCLKVQ